MKTLVRFTTLLALFALIFSTGITSAAAAGPTPGGVPLKNITAPAQALGNPQAVLMEEASTVAQSAPVFTTGKPVAQLPVKVISKNEPIQTGISYISVTSVWTAEGLGNRKTSFKPGDTIRWYGYVYNSLPYAQTAFFNWSLNTPCGSSTLYSGNLNVAAGTNWWYLPGTIPSNACGGTYTYSLSITFNGAVSSLSVNYSVGGNVAVVSAFTTNGSGTGKTSFNPGETIGWAGNVSNTTGSAKTALFTFALRGPCGSTNLYSGNLSTGNGTWSWSLNGTIPSNCPGTYTFSFILNYNGSITTKSAAYTVNGNGGSVAVISAFTTNGSGTGKTSFNPGETIGWAGHVSNTTGSAKTALFTFALRGPCGTSNLYNGNLSTGTGTWSWSMNGTIPNNCPGIYTFTFSLNYNGSITSKSADYTINGNSGSACNTSCQNQLNQSVRLLNGQIVLARNMGGTIPVSVLNDAYGKPGQFPFGQTNLGRTMANTPVTSNTSNRYSDLYLAVINQFGVDTNIRYVAGSGITYCNTYAGDVARAMGYPFPTKREYSGLNDPATIGFPNLYTWFTTNNSDPNKSSSARGWRSISDLQQIITSVNAGKIVVAVINGHIAVVRPGQSGVTSSNNLRTAQAGGTNSVNTTIWERFAGQTPLFFVHD